MDERNREREREVLESQSTEILSRVSKLENEALLQLRVSKRLDEKIDNARIDINKELNSLQESVQDSNSQILQLDNNNDQKYNSLRNELQSLRLIAEESTKTMRVAIENNKILQEQVNELVTVVDKQKAEVKLMKICQREVKEQVNDASRGSGGQMHRPSSIKFYPPTFGGHPSERPIPFLNKLEEFLKATRAYEYEFKWIIGDSLRGFAYDWWSLVRHKTNDLNDFKQLFIKKFWSDDAQHHVRAYIQTGAYDPRKGVSMSNYALRHCNNARDLIPAYNDKEIIRCMSRHFSQEVKYAILGRQIQTVEDLIALLDEFSHVGPVNAPHLNRSNITLSHNIINNQQRNYNHFQQSQHRGQTNLHNNNNWEQNDTFNEGKLHSGSNNYFCGEELMQVDQSEMQCHGGEGRIQENCQPLCQNRD